MMVIELNAMLMYIISFTLEKVGAKVHLPIVWIKT